MKQTSFHTLAIATAAILAGPAVTPVRAQTAPVVGFLQSTVPAATDAAVPGVAVLSFPLSQAPKSTGTVAAVGGADVLSVTGANWTAAQWTGAPHLVHLLSGESVGRAFLITGHTNAQLTLDTRGLDLAAAGIRAGDGVEIVPAHTLGSLFGTGSVLFQTGDSGATADLVSVWNGRKFKNYRHNGTSWVKGASSVSQNGVVVLPDTGVLVTRRATSALTLTFHGLPPHTVERSEVAGPASTLLANRFPVNTTFSALGLQTLPGWQSGLDASTADTVMLWKKTAWQTFGFDGANWRRTDTGAVADAKAIKAGTAVFVIRQSAASGVAATLTQTLPYSAN